MREILFKAKRKNWCELPKEEWWVEGYSVKYQPCASKDEWIYGIVPAYASALYIIEIDPETLCQYIYMKDKNGKRIWENDILRQKTTDEFKKYNPMEWEKYGIVKFGEVDWHNDWKGYCSMGFYIEHLKSISINPKDYCIGSIQRGINQNDILDECYPFEVIGNIFDNPELLGKSE